MSDAPPVALVTGSAQRLGAETVRHLHKRGWNLVIHYRSRQQQAEALAAMLNDQRPQSAIALQADLTRTAEIQALAGKAIAQWERLDALVNNASAFYPTPTHQATEEDWNELLNTNLKAPFFLLQACLPALRKAHGSVVNLIDIYSERPLADHPLYCASKAGLAALTRSWARDLAPEVRVNGVSPGAILWPEDYQHPASAHQKAILDKVALGRTGEPEDIARTIAFLICDSPYVTGHIIPVDGGRSLNI